jgi:hypothetical protein
VISEIQAFRKSLPDPAVSICIFQNQLRRHIVSCIRTRLTFSRAGLLIFTPICRAGLVMVALICHAGLVMVAPICRAGLVMVALICRAGLVMTAPVNIGSKIHFGSAYHRCCRDVTLSVLLCEQPWK